MEREVGKNYNTRYVMSNLIVLFQEAVRKDNVDEIKSLLLKYPKLLDDIGRSTWLQISFLTSCEHGSVRVAKELGRRWPELAIIQNQYGCTAMHIVAAKGDVEMIKFLTKLNHQSCLVEDNQSMIPLHLAAENGHSDVIRELITVCPESLEKLTPKQETALHLAIKNTQFCAFKVLVDETKNLSKEQLLNRKDNEGNTVLHIATLNKLIGIVKLLLLENAKSGILMRVNTKNKRGQTALDLCYANSQDMAFGEIGLILNEVGAANERKHFPGQLSPKLPGTRNFMELTRWPVETRNVLLVVLVMIAAAAFTVTCNLPSAFLQEFHLAGVTWHAEDVIYGRLPTVVYLMVFNSAGFMTTMAAVVVLIWPLHLRRILLFVVICTCIVYIILVDMITPKFFISLGTCRISSITLVWSSVLVFIFSGIGILSVGKYSSLYFVRFIN